MASSLREGVKSHDGQPFTSDDVIFTLGRAGSVPNSPGGFGGFMRNLASVEADGNSAVIINTKAPAPTLPGDLANSCHCVTPRGRAGRHRRL
ncbi:ABC transporter substrate-binding protein (plasmid) [Agrobacterium fabrum]|uniref:ABC transporter substrate-binding protein n=1 Tax=Agrobacterium fabrum TaxID=1176649 RepID=UPI001FCEA287|nr:ABC transporter substrate-binding protein [Agrobacterium fabrum]